MSSGRRRRPVGEAGRHLAADDPQRAVRFIAEIRARCRTLGRLSTVGRPAPGIGPDGRLLDFRADVILSRVDDGRILIDRALDASRDRSGLSHG